MPYQVKIHGPHGVIFEAKVSDNYELHPPSPNDDLSFLLKDQGRRLISGILTTANLIITPCPVVTNSDEGEG